MLRFALPCARTMTDEGFGSELLKDFPRRVFTFLAKHGLNRQLKNERQWCGYWLV